MSDVVPILPEPLPPHRRRGAFRLLFFALAAIGAGNTMLIATVLPQMTRTLELPDWMAGAIFSLSAAIWTLMSPYWGSKSSEWGRRPIAALGLAGYAVSMLLFFISGFMALSGFITEGIIIFLSLLLSRAIFGLIGSGANPAAQAYVADRTAPEVRTQEIASVTSGHSFGTVAGPAFAAALVAIVAILAPGLNEFSLLAPVVFTMFVAAGMSFLIWTRLPEDTPPKSVQPDGPKGQGVWRDPNVLPYLIFAAMLSLVSGVLVQTFVFAVIDKMAVAPEESAKFAGPAFSIAAMATLLAQLVLIPRLQLSNRMLMVGGALSLALGSFLIVPTSDYSVLIVAQFAIGLGQGLSRPGFFSGASLAVSPEKQGSVAGLVMACNGVGFVVSPLFGPFLYEEWNKAAPFLLASALLIFMAAFAFFKATAGEADRHRDALTSEDQ